MEAQSENLWLPIIEYSIKTGISLSTIRRKIKSSAIPYKLEKGKYLIYFGDSPPVQTPQLQRTPTPVTPATTPAAISQLKVSSPSEDPVRMVTDAFEYALKEKEERIRLLERRNKDLESHLDELRLLVQVLEEKYEVRY